MRYTVKYNREPIYYIKSNNNGAKRRTNTTRFILLEVTREDNTTYTYKVDGNNTVAEAKEIASKALNTPINKIAKLHVEKATY